MRSVLRAVRRLGMGQVVSAFWSLFASDKEFKILLVGLDNAGKTTTLYQLHLGQAVATQPTIGSNVETVKHKNVHFEVRTPRIQWIRRLTCFGWRIQALCERCLVGSC